MSTPQPIEGLHDPGLPPFLTKTYDIVEDRATDHIVSWSSGNNSFIVWDPQTFSITLLPRYFKHSNFSSFVRQLNTYGFRKVDPDRWEFANEGFLRGQKQLLKNIRRRKTAQQPPGGSHQTLEACVEVGRFGLEAEMDRLRRDKQVLIMELVKLRNQQQTTKGCLETMERRLRKTEKKQQQMMSFLAKALQNPAFLQQLMQQKDKRRELEEAINKKRRRQIDQGNNIIDDQLGQTQNLIAGLEDEELVFVKAEPDQNSGTTFDDQFQLLSNATDENVVGEVEVEDYSYDEMVINKGKEVVDQELIWEDIFNGGANIVTQEIVDLGRVDDEEDMDVLVQQLEYLRSSPK